MESQVPLLYQNSFTYIATPTSHDTDAVDMPLSEYLRLQSLQASSRFLHRPISSSIPYSSPSPYSVESSQNKLNFSNPSLLCPEVPQARDYGTGHGHGRGILYHDEAVTGSSSGKNNASDETRPLDLLAIVATLRLIIMNNRLDVDGDSATRPSDSCGHGEAVEASCFKKMPSMPRTATQREAIDVRKLRELLRRLGIMATQICQPSRNRFRRKRKRLQDLCSGSIIVEEDAAGFRAQQESMESSAVSGDGDEDLAHAQVDEAYQMRRNDEEGTVADMSNDCHTDAKDAEFQKKDKTTDSVQLMSKREAKDFLKNAFQNPKLSAETADFDDEDADNVSQAELTETEIQKRTNNKGIVMPKQETTEFDAQKRNQEQTSISDNMQQSSSETGSDNPIAQNDIQITDAESSPGMGYSKRDSGSMQEEYPNTTGLTSIEEVVDEQISATIQDEDPNPRSKRARSHALPRTWSRNQLT